MDHSTNNKNLLLLYHCISMKSLAHLVLSQVLSCMQTLHTRVSVCEGVDDELLLGLQQPEHLAQQL